MRADATVTFAALKPGLLLGQGPERSGTVEVADIGLDVSGASTHLVEDADVPRMLPRRPRDAHKWQTAVYVAAGSPGMRGAAGLCSRAAMRAGAGMVRLGMPGAGPSDLPASEVVARALPAAGWAEDVLSELERFRALVVGPGLGQGDGARTAVRRLVAEAPIPVIVDADGLNLLGGADEVRALASGRRPPLLLTPHDGEFSRLAGERPGADRLAATRALARATSAVVLLKGSTTVVAAPAGRALLSAAGSARLATAGTGDVLSGVIAAFVAQGLETQDAAALAAHAHGAAAGLCPERGLVAGDLVRLLPAWLSAVTGAAGG